MANRPRTAARLWSEVLKSTEDERTGLVADDHLRRDNVLKTISSVWNGIRSGLHSGAST